MRELEKWIAKGMAIHSRIKCKQFGDKCSKQFFQVVRQKNIHSVILLLKNKRVELVNKREELEAICFDFYSQYTKGNLRQKLLEERYLRAQVVPSWIA